MAATETLDQVEDDIHELRARITTLRAHRANLASVLLSQPSLSTRLQTSIGATPDNSLSKAYRLIAEQQKRNTENIYRSCAGVTAYKVLDPDPHAINNGNILGISIDVSLGGKNIDTYHILLNSVEQDDAGNKLLRIYKHTIPPCIPLQQLARRWLPDADEKQRRQQDLVRFGKILRKELVSWHLRVQAVEKMRKEAELDKQQKDVVTETVAGGTVLNAFVSDDEESSDIEADDRIAKTNRIVEIESDTAVRQIIMTWSDRRTAILNVTKDGRVEKAVCRTKKGRRDTEFSRKAIGPLAGFLRRL